MHDDLRHLDLTFPAIPVGEREIPLNLRRLLYKGGASIPVGQVDQAINDGLLGHVQPDRAELVRLIHEYISGVLASGARPETGRRLITNTIPFFGWADSVCASLNISEVEKTYIDWSEHLLRRFRVIKDLKQLTAYNQARVVGQVLDGVLGRAKPIVRVTKLKRPPDRKRPLSAKEDKQNLHATFAFGRLLQDICDGTPLNIIRTAPLVRIPLQQGGEIEFKLSRRPRLPEDKRPPFSVRASIRAALAYEADRSLDHRFRREMVNLRLQAELLMFIGQTGMNLAQALVIPLRRFSYSSDINSYKVREYKPRRKGVNRPGFCGGSIL
ncbi:hypothetical protein [Massilia sp.]|uniref:hypothetical protein n=1 Tax=Massilia sp. TaxID=1882437 RepID=UPI00289EF3DF|nr:hypothetical protein [Massilia sp.]